MHLVQEVVEALIGAEGLEEGNQCLRGELLDVLDGDANNDLKVLADVDPEHIAEDLNAVFSGDLAHVAYKELRIQRVGVHDHTLDVCLLGVVLQCALEEASLLAHLRNALAVVVGEHGVTHDGVSYLRCVHQVDFQQAGLEVALFRLVALQDIKQQGGGLLYEVAGHQQVNYGVQVDECTTLTVDQLRGQGSSTRRVDCHDAGEQEHVVRGIVHLLGVGHNLVVLPSLSKEGDHLVGSSSAIVDRESEFEIMGFNLITQLL